MKGRAIIVGGSISGLFTATLLLKAGWDVEVFERSAHGLGGRGAGIVTHKQLIDALEAAGAATDTVGVMAQKRIAFDRAGNVTHAFDFPQLVTSWDRLLDLIRPVMPDERYHLGRAFDRFETTPAGVRAYFEDGETLEADLLVAADGFRSQVRAQLFPQVQPEYAGYVAWRTLAAEADLSADVRENIFGNFSFFLPQGDGEMLGYPIAGPHDDLRVGHRRYFLGWYRIVDPARLKEMLTDANGVVHDLSIPPPLIRPEVIEELRSAARQSLAPQFASIMDQVEAPFFTPIYDHASPTMIADRVAMVGDAAFGARPHIGAGVTKAAQDALALANALSAATDLDEGLQAYNAERFGPCRAAYDRARYLGEYLMPRYTNDEEKAEWAREHNIETIMRDTAFLNFY